MACSVSSPWLQSVSSAWRAAGPEKPGDPQECQREPASGSETGRAQNHAVPSEAGQWGWVLRLPEVLFLDYRMRLMMLTLLEKDWNVGPNPTSPPSAETATFPLLNMTPCTEQGGSAREVERGCPFEAREVIPSEAT